jgi:hypothetical protein
MKLHTNVFFFAALMVVSFAARAEGEVAGAGLLDQAKAAAVAAWNHVYAAGEHGVHAVVKASDAVVVYAKDGVVAAGKGVTTLGNTMQENPGYTAAVVGGTIATVAVGYVVYQNYFASCSDCKESKKAKTPKSNN